MVSLQIGVTGTRARMAGTLRSRWLAPRVNPRTNWRIPGQVERPLSVSMRTCSKRA